MRNKNGDVLRDEAMGGWLFPKWAQKCQRATHGSCPATAAPRNLLGKLLLHDTARLILLHSRDGKSRMQTREARVGIHLPSFWDSPSILLGFTLHTFGIHPPSFWESHSILLGFNSSPPSSRGNPTFLQHLEWSSFQLGWCGQGKGTNKRWGEAGNGNSPGDTPKSWTGCSTCCSLPIYYILYLLPNTTYVLGNKYTQNKLFQKHFMP